MTDAELAQAILRKLVCTPDEVYSDLDRNNNDWTVDGWIGVTDEERDYLVRLREAPVNP